MKKMTKAGAVVLCIALAACFAACGKKEAAPATEAPATEAATEAPATEPVVETTAEEETEAFGGGSGSINPMTEYDSLEEINEIAGSQLCHPAVMGVTEEHFFINDKAFDQPMAEYQFELNGYSYNFRCAAVSNQDISGLYSGDGEGTVFPAEPENDVEIFTGSDFKACRWFTLDGQYVFSVMDNGEMSEETFANICEEMRDMTAVGETYAEISEKYSDLAGSYMDSFSQRAGMVVEDKGDCVGITITWSSSANEYTEWVMTAKMYEDGLLSYSDCVKTNYTGEEGEVEFENGEGCFAPTEDGKLEWSLAEDEYCQQCVFEKVPE